MVAFVTINRGSFKGDPNADDAYDAFGDANTNFSQALNKDGSVGLTANWDVGAFSVTALSFITDTISEETLNAGVTIDGVLLQDNKMDWSYISNAPATYAPSSHAYDTHTGSVPFAALPTGTTSSTVAVGDHSHAGYGTMSSWDISTTTGDDTLTQGSILHFAAGTGLDITTTDSTGPDYTITIAHDLSEFTDMTADIVGTDEIICLDSGFERRKAFSELKLSVFNNDSNWNNYSFTVSEITGQTALTSGLVGTDELLVSDGGVLKKMDVSVLHTYVENNMSKVDGQTIFIQSTTPTANATDDIWIDTA